MEGWLKKKGEYLGSYFWKDRYFKEENGRLNYYTDKSLATPKGFIELSQIKNVRPRTDNFGASASYGFEIEVEGRTYILQTSTESEQLTWVNEILSRINKKAKYVVHEDDWQKQLKSVARSVVVTISNSTPFVLERDSFKLHGTGQIWKKFPPEKLNPGDSFSFGSCSSTLISGTCASVTYKVKIDLDYHFLWFRWENPFRKFLFASKKALYEAPERIQIKATEDLTESHKFLLTDSDTFRIHYNVSFDPLIQATINLGQSPTSKSLEDWVDLAQTKTGPIISSNENGPGQIVKTSFGETKYYGTDWIPILKTSARSVLVTVINETNLAFDRADWSLSRGLWRCIPQEHIKAKSVIQFGTGSHGLFGFKSGTIGSVTYKTTFVGDLPGNQASPSNSKQPATISPKYKKTTSYDAIITFDWTNHIVWGIHNNIQITSNSPQSFVAVTTEANNTTSYEITFTIIDPSNPKSTSALTQQDGSVPSSSNQNETSQPKLTAAKKLTLPKRVQSDGVTVNLTEKFFSMRKEKVDQLKSERDQIDNDFRIASHHLISRFKKKEENESFFGSFFSKDSLEEEAENIAPTFTAQQINQSNQCPITGLAFKSIKEKGYCYICGRIVSRKALNIVPFRSEEMSSLVGMKKKPQGLQLCLDCQATLASAETQMAWKERLSNSKNHPVLEVHDGIIKAMRKVKQSLAELRKMLAVKDKEAPMVLSKIQTMFEDIDRLQLELFNLNEEAPRAEQKLNNKLALYITEWKDETAPEIEALEEAVSKAIKPKQP